LDSLQKAYAEPRVQCAFLFLKAEGKLVFVFVLPRYDGVALTTKFVQFVNETSVENLRLEILVRLRFEFFIATNVFNLVFGSVVLNCGSISTVRVFGDYLHVVLLPILAEKNAEVAGADVQPLVLGVQVVQFGSILLRRQQGMCIARSTHRVRLNLLLQTGLNFLQFLKCVKKVVCFLDKWREPSLLAL